MAPRQFRAGQRADVHVVDVATGEVRLVHSSDTVLLEAPNWTPDGSRLLVNGDGMLFALSVDGGGLDEVPLGGVPPINNDHVVSPDGKTVFVSADDGHIHAVGLDTGVARRVTNDRGAGFRHYLHGVSPDGETLAYIGVQEEVDGPSTANVFLIPSDGGRDVQLTDDRYPDDGCEFSSDGQWIYFNSERGSSVPGHAQLFRMKPDGNGIEQLTHDERVNWFPHQSPDGTMTAYISFPPGTLGHPEDLDVVVRLIGPDGGVRDVAHLFGGQGTLNVPSWAPDSSAFAFVSYPIGR